jgi:hypothetical protein
MYERQNKNFLPKTNNESSPSWQFQTSVNDFFFTAYCCLWVMNAGLFYKIYYSTYSLSAASEPEDLQEYSYAQFKYSNIPSSHTTSQHLKACRSLGSS